MVKTYFKVVRRMFRKQIQKILLLNLMANIYSIKEIIIVNIISNVKLEDIQIPENLKEFKGTTIVQNNSNIKLSSNIEK